MWEKNENRYIEECPEPLRRMSFTMFIVPHGISSHRRHRSPDHLLPVTVTLAAQQPLSGQLSPRKGSEKCFTWTPYGLQVCHSNCKQKNFKPNELRLKFKAQHCTQSVLTRSSPSQEACIDPHTNKQSVTNYPWLREWSSNLQFSQFIIFLDCMFEDSFLYFQLNVQLLLHSLH